MGQGGGIHQAPLSPPAHVQEVERKRVKNPPPYPPSHIFIASDEVAVSRVINNHMLD